MIKLANNIYIVDDRVNFCGASIQTRMAVIILIDGSLLIYSPVSLTAELTKQLAELGTVAYVIAPNKIHNQALKDYAATFSNAQIFAAPGLPERKPEINYAGVLTDQAEPAWAGEVEQVLTKGNDFFSEVILYHKASKTLLVCDFIENINKSTISMLPLFKLFGVREKPMASPEFRMYTTNEALAKQALVAIKTWDFKRIFLCHGDIIEHNAKAIFNDVCTEYLAAAKKRSWLYKKFSLIMAKYQ